MGERWNVTVSWSRTPTTARQWCCQTNSKQSLIAVPIEPKAAKSTRHSARVVARLVFK